jgi:hypothetical protein
MGNGVAALVATHNPKLSAAASQQGTEVVSVNQDAAVLCQHDHLLWSRGGVELTPQLWIPIQPIQEVIQGIQ